ncbi:MAG TPA: hypothetical protein VMU92_10955 [Acidobacteriaceae bacterium]|nr:hypothetical protein [Acidobacteriaceae bacterium]
MRAFAVLAALLALALSLPARAQYIGRVKTNQNDQPTLRAIAVLEYTGPLDHPNASRLIPIAVWDGDNYQPGGQYLAQPIPLTVQTGTQYILEHAGTPKGFFDVKAASNANGSWIAIGNYQKPAAQHYAKLHPSRMAPIMFGGGNGKPHFAHVPAGDTGQGAPKSTTTAQNNTPSTNSEEPTLHRRTGSSGSQNTNTTTRSNAPPIDPDRPIMREPTPPSPAGNTASAANTPGAEAPETPTSASDPNRPHFEYGSSQSVEKLDKQTRIEITRLAGHPVHLKQMVAVSDAVNRPTHSYVYSWPDPGDEAKTRSALETIAQQLLAQSAPAKPAPQKVTPTPHHRAAHHSRRAAKKPAPPAPPVLTDVQCKAYQLTYGGGVTLVFSATAGQDESARYITLVAQLDFSGTPIVLFKSITSWPELNFIPRMKLIDAVDTNADNRAELIFALETQTSRRYAIYGVENNTVLQLYPVPD